MLIISYENWQVNKQTCRILISVIGFCILSFSSFSKSAIGYEFEDVIRSFERDFNRENPVKMKGRFETIIQAVTGMKNDKTVNIVFKSRGDVKQETFTEQMKKQNLKDENMILGYEYLLKQFGLLEQEYTLKDVLLGSQYDSVYGFYKPKNKHIVLIEGTNKAIAADTLFHELVHSAQDGTIDLEKYYTQYGNNHDSSLAASALVEGQATAVPILVQIEQNLQDKTTVEILQPFIDQMDNDFFGMEREEKDFLTDLNTFPYFFGLRFVLQRYVTDKSNFVGMFDRVPISTEQILHPKKFEVNEKPIATKLQKKISSISKLPDVTLMLDTTLGEFFISQLFHDVLEPDIVNAASSGWGGDLVLVLQSDKGLFLIWDTVWDSKKDAQEFYDGFIKYSKKLFNIIDLPQKSGFNRASKKGKTHIYLKTEKKRIVIIEGNVPPATLKTLNKI
jgi:hypothetical protein